MDFTSLQRLIEAVASEIEISEDEADAARGLNREPLSTDPFQKALQLSGATRRLQLARASDLLFQRLNKAPGQRPSWFELSAGYPVLDDSVSRDGMRILISSAGGSIDQSAVPDMNRRVNEIGFMQEDIWAYLDQNLMSCEGSMAEESDLEAKKVPDAHNEVSGHESGVCIGVADQAVDSDKLTPPSSGVERLADLLEARKNKNEGYAEKMIHLIDKEAIAPLKSQIIKALAGAKEPSSLVSVWKELKLVVGNEINPDFELTAEGTIKIVRLGGGYIRYDKDSLGAFLLRYKNRLNVNSANGRDE